MKKTGEAFDCLLGERIAALRNKRGLSQKELGDWLGRGRSYIDHIEAGRTSVTTFNLLRLCNILDVPLEELLAGNEVSGPPVRIREVYRLECDDHGNVAEFGNITDALGGLGVHVRFMHVH